MAEQKKKEHATRASVVPITSQPPKTSNGDRKWIKFNLRIRDVGKRHKLPGPSQLVQSLKFLRGLNQNLKFFRAKTVTYSAC